MAILPNDEVKLAVRMPADLRRAVKLYAAANDKTIEAVVRETLEARVAAGTPTNTATTVSL
jgi:hypothetical protein